MKRFNTELDFLGNYWNEAKNIGRKIKQELSVGTSDSSNLRFINKDSGLKIFLVNYSELGNSWSVQDIMNKIAGNSKTIEILADKINYMILKGRANDVKPMIEKICTGRIKSLSKETANHDLNKKSISDVYHKQFLGRGHFRWNYKAHTLNKLEIEQLKKYFKL